MGRSNMPVIRADSMEEAMLKAGFQSWPGMQLTPGKFIRFRTYGSSASGWAKVFEDGRGGVFGDWVTDESYLWLANDARYDAATAAMARLQAEAMRRKREMEQQKAWEKTAKEAQAIWEQGEPVPCDHPYLVAKGIEPDWEIGSIRMHRDRWLMVPLVMLEGEQAGQIVSLQFIAPDGRKRFMSGGRTQGAAWSIRGDQTQRIVICEGVATAITLANVYTTEDTCVMAAFNAGNLTPVAASARALWPDAEITIAADNDHRTPDNPGLTKASKAAAVADASITYPLTRFLGNGTDFNDLYLMQKFMQKGGDQA